MHALAPAALRVQPCVELGADATHVIPTCNRVAKPPQNSRQNGATTTLWCYSNAKRHIAK